MKVLFDTNVVLDVLLDRKPHVDASLALMTQVEQKKIKGYLCANSVTTLDYLITKTLNRTQAKHTIKNLLSLFSIAPVNESTLRIALDLDFSDFEDAVLYQSAIDAGINAIVTRNGRYFKKAKLPIYSPQELLNLDNF